MKNGVILETMMISRTERIPAFSIRTRFSVSTGTFYEQAARSKNVGKWQGPKINVLLTVPAPRAMHVTSDRFRARSRQRTGYVIHNRRRDVQLANALEVKTTTDGWVQNGEVDLVPPTTP